MFNITDLNLIQEAQKQCESLAVGVYSDEAEKLKNGRQPIISCEDRKRIVGAIKGVDSVIEIADIEQLQMKREQLKSLIEESLASETLIPQEPKKYPIGFIQGTFDMFHSGHLNLINRAKLQCEKLIVGVNTDRLVEEYKKKTPIVQFEDRLRIVEAIKGVDEIVEMDDRNKIRAARELNFNALIMGNDWQGTEFYKIMEEELRRIGVDVVYLPYTQGISSSKLRKKIGKDECGNDLINSK